MRRSSLASAPQPNYPHTNDDNNTSPVRSTSGSGGSSSFLGDKGSTDNTESFTLTYAAFTIPASVQKYDDTQYTILDCQREYETLIDQTEKTLENLYEIRLKSSQLLKGLHKTEQALDQAATASTSTNPFSSLLSLGSSNNNSNNNNNGNPVNIASLGDNVSTIEYNDGSKYKGHLDTNRVRHGKGTYYYPSGTVYKGEWENGGRHGLGVCEFVSHNQYIGYWTQGRREGLGVFMFTKERKQMDLPIPWKQSPIFDQYALLATSEKESARPQPSTSSATSSLVFPFFRKPKEEPQTNNTVSIQSELLQLFDDRERYEGMFLHDQRHGFGVYYFPDGSCYSGGWKNNRRHGKGAYFFTSGRIYVGDWINSQRHGNGVMKDHTGQILYKGEWVNDRKEGKGTQHDNGDWITAIWKANRIEKILYVELFPLKHRLKCILQRDCIVKNKSKLKYSHQNAFKDITIEWAR